MYKKVEKAKNRTPFNYIEVADYCYRMRILGRFFKKGEIASLVEHHNRQKENTRSCRVPFTKEWYS
jgi:hypothetical protein